MGLREIILMLAIPVLLFMIFSSFAMIERQLQENKISKYTGVCYRYCAILCPPLTYILLRLKK